MPRASPSNKRTARTPAGCGVAAPAPATTSNALSGDALSNVSDRELVGFLFEAYRILRVSTPAVTVDDAFVRQLLTPRFLKSTSPDVAQMTGAILCDVCRLYRKRAMVPPACDLPFPLKACDDVLQCLLQPFAHIVSRHESLQKCEYIIERACASRALLYILPHCRAENLQTHLQSMFEAVRNASQSTAAPTTTVTATEMAQVVGDALLATNSATEEQLAPLLAEVIAASPTLRNISGTTAPSVQLRENTAAVGAHIAARVFLKHMDIFQTTLASLALAAVERGVEQVVAADIAGEKTEGKRTGLREVSKGLEILVAMTELHVNLVSQLLPGIVPYLQHDQPDVRVLVLRGLSSSLMANETAAIDYRAALQAVLARLSDVKPVLRIEAIVQVGKLMQSSATRHWAVATVEELWASVRPLLDQRLLDVNPSVRRQAVQTYCDIIAALSGTTLFENQDEQMQASLGLRTMDKHAKVRDTAVERLAALYRECLGGWIPNALLNATRSDAGARAVEVHLESMLPPPTQCSPHGSPTRGSLGVRPTPRSHGASMAIFDFEKEELRRDRSYVDAFLQLCRDLSSRQSTQLLAVLKKKPALRRTVSKLFELRAVIRRKDPKSPEGQLLIHSIHRLLQFLQDITGAEKGEWDALFRAKDDRIGKAFTEACRHSNVSWGHERGVLLQELKGRIESEVYNFVEGSLLKQLMFPVDIPHVDELLERMGKSQKAAMPPLEDLVCMLRALLAFTAASPAYLPRCAPTLLTLLGSLVTTAAAHGNGVPQIATADSPCPDNAILPQCVLLLLHSIREWAIYEKPNTAESAASLTVSESAKHEALGHLSQLCTGAVPTLLGGDTVDRRMAAKIAKQSARTVMAVLSISSYESAKTLSLLVDSLRAPLHHRALPLVADPRTIAWLHSIRALAQDSLSAGLLQDGSLFDDLGVVLTAAAKDNSDSADRKRVKRPAAGVKPAASAATLPYSATSAIVEGSAKAMVSYVLGSPVERRTSLTSSALSVLLQGYKAVCEEGTHTNSSVVRRLAILKQFVRLLTHPSADMEKELAVSMLLSSEDDVMVRQSVQAKLTTHALRSGCDMRYTAFLLLTAISEEGKASYQELRSMVQTVGDHLRGKQAALGVSLSSPEGLRCYLEYTIPFLVLFMAHHALYEGEKDAHQFLTFQRVWHLLYDELFRHGTQCAPFVMELFSRIKQSDDVFDPSSDATRVLCDLGSKVLHAVLGQRQVCVADLKRYPGAVLLPNFFVRTAHPNPLLLLDTVYMDPSVNIAVNTPFRPLTGSAARGEGTPRQTPAASVERESEQTPGGVVEDAPTNNDRSSHTCRSTQRRRARSPSGEDGCSSKRRAFTEPPLPDAVASTAGGQRGTPAQVIVEKTLDVALAGLSKHAIVRMKWKVLRTQLEEALQSAQFAVEDRDALITYAKEQLRIRYANASDE